MRNIIEERGDAPSKRSIWRAFFAQRQEEADGCVGLHDGCAGTQATKASSCGMIEKILLELIEDDHEATLEASHTAPETQRGLGNRWSGTTGHGAETRRLGRWRGARNAELGQLCHALK